MVNTARDPEEVLIDGDSQAGEQHGNRRGGSPWGWVRLAGGGGRARWCGADPARRPARESGASALDLDVAEPGVRDDLRRSDLHRVLRPDLLAGGGRHPGRHRPGFDLARGPLVARSGVRRAADDPFAHLVRLLGQCPARRAQRGRRRHRVVRGQQRQRRPRIGRA